MIPRTSSRSRSSFSRHSRRTPIAVVGDGAEGNAEPTADSSSRSSESISSSGEASSSKHTVWGGMAAHMDHPESMQGWLHKKHTHKKRLTHQWGKRYFVLDAEKMILRYHKSESSKKPRAVFHLSTVSLELVDDGTPHAFNIVTSDLTLTVHAESRAEYGKWTGAITAATIALERKTGRMPLGAAPAVGRAVNTNGGAAGVPAEALPAAASVVAKRRPSEARSSNLSAEDNEAADVESKPNRGRRISFDLGSGGALPGVRGNESGEANKEGGAQKRPEQQSVQVASQKEAEQPLQSQPQPQPQAESPPHTASPPPQQPPRLESASSEALGQDSDDGRGAGSDDGREGERGVLVSPGGADRNEQTLTRSDSAENALAANNAKAQAANGEKTYEGSSLGDGMASRSEACDTAQVEDGAIEAFVMSESESEEEGTPPNGGGSPPVSQRSVEHGAEQPGSGELRRALHADGTSKEDSSNKDEICRTQIAPMAGGGESEPEHGSGDSDGGVGIGIGIGVGIGVGDGDGGETHSSSGGAHAAPAAAAAPHSNGAEPTWLAALAGMSSSEDDDDDPIGLGPHTHKGGGSVGAARPKATETKTPAVSIPPKKQAAANDWDSEEDEDGSDDGSAALPSAAAVTAIDKVQESSDSEGSASPPTKARQEAVKPTTQDKPQAKGEAGDDGSDWDDDDD